MQEARLLTKKELYEEIYRDPNLTRLGPYKVVADPGMEIFAIDVDLSGRELILGDGDFTETFVAFEGTKAKKVDFGNCRFSQLYLDYLEAELLCFGTSQASSIMFDRAKIGSCEFDEFKVQELCFDELTAREIHINELTTGRIFVGFLSPCEVYFDSKGPGDFKIIFDENGVQTFGELKIEELRDFNYREPGGEEREGARPVTIQEFIDLVEAGGNLRTLGLYKVVAEDENNILEIPSDSLQEIDFGRGDFRGVEVKFVNPELHAVRLDLAIFGTIALEGGHIETVDLGKAKADSLIVRDTDIGTVFCDGIDVSHCEFDEVDVNYFFLNNLLCENLKFTASAINEMYASRGRHGEIYFDGCKLRIFNGHEATFKMIDFGKSEIDCVVMRATSVEGLLDATELKAERFMVGYYDNNIENLEVKESTLGTKEGIEKLTFRKIEPNEIDREFVESRRENAIPKEFKLR